MQSFQNSRVEFYVDNFVKNYYINIERTVSLTQTSISTV